MLINEVGVSLRVLSLVAAAGLVASTSSPAAAQRALRLGKAVRVTGQAESVQAFVVNLAAGQDAEIRLAGGTGERRLFADFEPIEDTSIEGLEGLADFQSDRSDSDAIVVEIDDPLPGPLYVYVYGDEDYRNASLRVRGVREPVDGVLDNSGELDISVDISQFQELQLRVIGDPRLGPVDELRRPITVLSFTGDYGGGYGGGYGGSSGDDDYGGSSGDDDYGGGYGGALEVLVARRFPVTEQNAIETFRLDSLEFETIDLTPLLRRGRSELFIAVRAPGGATAEIYGGSSGD